MPVDVRLSWPAVLSLGLGATLCYLAYQTWGFRDRPGAKFWAGVQTAAAVWGISYGASLLVFTPEYRILFEPLVWIGRLSAAPLILAFALEYTGRGRAPRSYWMGGLFSFYALSFGLYMSNIYIAATGNYASSPVAGLVLSGYQVEPVFGAAAVAYSLGPLGYAVSGLAYVLIGIAMVLLLKTVLSYGTLYRRQAVVLVAAVVPPSVANVAWLFRLPPTRHLEFTPIAFIFTALFGTYALFREEMFELLPATHRIANRVTIEDLGTAVVVLSPDARVIDYNDEAADLLAVDDRPVLAKPLTAIVDVGIPLESTTFAATDPFGRGREFNVTVSPITSPAGRSAGYTVTFQDVTVERLRQQRLSVLNRVLRHNLRNSMNVIRGNAEMIRRQLPDTDTDASGSSAGDRSTDDIVAETLPLLETIVDTSEELSQIGHKVQKLENGGGTSTAEETDVALGQLCTDLAAEFEAEFPDADVSVDADPVTVRTNERILSLVVENLIENGIVHDDGEPSVRVTVRKSGEDGTAAIDIEDDGPGIPDHELTVFRKGEEDPLEHGSGIGLWIVSWGARMLGGDVSFSVDESGTTARIRLPEETTSLLTDDRAGELLP